MAAGTLSPPGTEYGPCEGECQHRDCASTRRMASLPCRICGEEIGYETSFFVEETDPEKSQVTVMVHALCAYREDEASR